MRENLIFSFFYCHTVLFLDYMINVFIYLFMWCCKNCFGTHILFLSLRLVLFGNAGEPHKIMCPGDEVSLQLGPR